MSAASMLSCACDEIIMGKQSSIGPIDPQMTLTKPNGVDVTSEQIFRLPSVFHLFFTK
ncbi:MAG: hypothetical protein IJJ15_04055 [Ruminococcus sp.]|nr:hypothetical protein [Ruminococcus sp.]